MYWFELKRLGIKDTRERKLADEDCRQAEIHHIADPTDGVNRLESELEALRNSRAGIGSPRRPEHIFPVASLAVVGLFVCRTS